ncbi:GerAB/ArcD/ProY family transporter [Paenibacillus paeoniae]|uniref:Uncharacterized protein n=1 Tax=Paenibacillus paeoniae TaxID=2292705 RepID=A0A371PKQ6_9BACL|nr:endospore germination permease [Paenibacillus paeoniae]REK76790.1 hypothetical protein DX130_07080 [Paenibacillus paeoniae]
MKALSTWQIYSLMLLFQMGTNVVFGFAGTAKQDAWIVAFLSTLGAFLLQWLYYKLYATRPGENWTSLLKLSFGRYLGTFLHTVYIVVFLYLAARNLRDLGEVTKVQLLFNTPPIVDMMIFQLLVAYICYAGIQRMGRLAELNMPIIFLFIVLQIILISFSGIMDFSRLMPVAENWNLIATTVFPFSISVPYSETFVFSMFGALTVAPRAYKKAAMLSVASAGLIFTIWDILSVSTLGSTIFSRSFFPLMTTFQMINIADFITNIDPVIVTNYMITLMIKIAVYALATCAGIARLCKLDSYKSIIMPVSLLVIVLAYFMTDNLSSHLFVAINWTGWLILLPLFIVLPAIVLVIMTVKNRRTGEGRKLHEPTTN